MNLTGRQLVGELSRLGLGTWTPDAVRQWIREEPPCPIAEPADQGKPHRYNLMDVLHWLLARTQRDKAHGFTSAHDQQLAQRLERAIQAFVTGQPLGISGPVPEAAPPASAPEASDAPALPTALTKSFDFGTASELEALMEVIRTNRPAAWKATEEALNQRRKRMEAEGKLVPVEDLQRALDTQALATRNIAQSLIMPLAQRIADSSTLDQRRLLIQSAIDGMLQRLATDDTEGLARGDAE